MCACGLHGFATSETSDSRELTSTFDRGRLPRSHGHAQSQQTTNHACSRRPLKAGPQIAPALPATRRRRRGLRARRPHQPTATSSPRPPDAWPRARHNCPRRTQANPGAHSQAPRTRPAARLRQCQSLQHSSRSLPLGRQSPRADPVGMNPLAGNGPWSLAMKSGPLGGGQSSASRDDGRSVVSDRLEPPYLPW